MKHTSIVNVNTPEFVQVLQAVVENSERSAIDLALKINGRSSLPGVLARVFRRDDYTRTQLQIAHSEIESLALLE